MAWCPITKEQCTDECAWFKKSRRKFQDGHIEGDCSVIGVGQYLKEVTAAIKSLENTIINKNFTE